MEIANVWNVDETFVKVLPMPKRAWSAKARPESSERRVPEDKASSTVKPGCLRPCALSHQVRERVAKTVEVMAPMAGLGLGCRLHAPLCENSPALEGRNFT